MAQDETSVRRPTGVPMPPSPIDHNRRSARGFIAWEPAEPSSATSVTRPATQDGNEGLAGWTRDWPGGSAVFASKGSTDATRTIDVEQRGLETAHITPAQQTASSSQEAAISPASSSQEAAVIPARSATPAVASATNGTPDVSIQAAPTAEKKKYPKPEDLFPPPNPDLFTEFEKKYPPDVFGEEANPNARVWRVYRDHVTDLDGDLLDAWHKTLDVLLIFIGLFLGVTTAFIIESSQRLQPDFGEITARGVIALLSQADPSIITPVIPSLDNVELTARAMWINGLWFASFTLALVDALLAILAKQWLVEYASKQRQPVANAQHWAWRHYAFRHGLDRWGIGVFISALSVILYLALYLFLFGLLVFLFELNAMICASSMALTILVAVFHVATTLAPLRWGDCPTTTPLLSHLSWSYNVVLWLLSCTYHFITQSPRILASAWNQLRLRIIRLGKNRSGTDTTMNDESESSIAPWPTLATFQAQQSKPAYDGAAIIRGHAPLRDSKVLVWMIENLLTDADVGVAVEAIGACDLEQHASYAWPEGNLLQTDTVGRAAEKRLISLARLDEQREKVLHQRRQASTLRTLLFIRWTVEERNQSIVQALFNVQAYDIGVLSDILHDRCWTGAEVHFNSFEKIGERCANAESLGTRHTHDITKLMLWKDTEGAPKMEREGTLLLPGELHVIYGILESASQEPVFAIDLNIALTISDGWLARQVALRFDQTVHHDWVDLAESYKDDAALAVFVKWGFALSDVEIAGQLQLDTEVHLRIFERILLHASGSAKQTPWPVSLVENGLSIFAQPHGESSLRRQWPTPVRLAALKIFGKLDLTDSWSPKMTRLLHSLLRTSSELGAVDQSLPAAVWSFPWSSNIVDSHKGAISVIKKHLQPKVILFETAVGALLCRPAGGRSPSSWELVMNMSHDLPWDSSMAAQYLAVTLAIISQIWPEPHDLDLLVDALIGGERGIRLALAGTNDFVLVAKHARVASPGWWTKYRTSLSAIPTEQWKQRKLPDQHATPKALVDEIDEHDDCSECLDAIQKCREGPGPNENTSQVPVAHDSPAAVPAVFTSGDIHQTEPSTLWTDNFGLSRAFTAVRAAVRFRTPQQRAQHDVEMQLTPLVASTSLQPDSSTRDTLDHYF